MKSSFKKLKRGFSLSKFTSREKSSPPPTPPDLPPKDLDATLENMKVVKNMMDKYDNLLAAAQTISGASCDFAKAIQEMASCMLEMFGKTSDGETVNVFTMLAKVQFEIAKFLETYATHVSWTIIKPANSLIKELQSIEEIKLQYEEKRRLHDHLGIQKEKSKGGKGDAAGSRLSAVKEELRKQEMQFDIRFKSLKHGQELGLVTQAVRHYTAQSLLFNKSLKTLSTIESSVKRLSQKLKIDRTLNEDNLETMRKARDEEKVISTLPPLSGTQETTINTGTEDFLLQKLPEKETAKYALPNPNNTTNTRRNIQPLVRFETNDKVHVIETKVYEDDDKNDDDGDDDEGGEVEVDDDDDDDDADDADDDDDGVASLETNTKQRHSAWSPRHAAGSSIDFTYLRAQDMDLSSASSSSMGRIYTQSGPLPARYAHSGPLQPKLKVHTRQSSGDIGDIFRPTQNLYHHHQQQPHHKVSKSSLPIGFVSPCVSPPPPSSSAPVINELHKLPTPPDNVELMHNKPPTVVKHSSSPSPVKKSRSISSSAVFAKSLHRSTSLSCESPIVELPP